MPEKVTQIVQPNTSDIIPTDITKEMQEAYLDYAMSVIVSRALPDVRDGLKPVQRRIIYDMQEQNMTHTSKFYKCAAVVGDVMKKYHPHGDLSIYDALVRMGQDWTLRYPLIKPQGNFGSIDGDPPAAHRYTECKLEKISDELYGDIEKETVPFDLNDMQNYEPRYLPAVLPNLLINGVQGIAVGMATSIPPHNLREIIDGLVALIDTADVIGTEALKDDVTKLKVFDGKLPDIEVKVAKTAFSSASTVEDLIKLIKGPDFPTGGIIYDQREIIGAYATGSGKIITRAKMEVEESSKGKVSLVVTEIPYMVNKATLVSKIADLAKEKKIEGLADLRDESNKDGLRIVIELKRDAIVNKVQNRLFKYTQLQNTFNANFVALINGEPKKLTLKMMLEEFIKHRQEIIVKRTLFLLRKIKEREHILLGLKKAIDIIDEIIAHIKKSKDAEAAKVGLIEKFGFSEIQAQAILDMQLRRLAALERQRIEDELKEILNTIKNYEELLAFPKLILKEVKNEFLHIKEKYGDERKTKVIKGKLGELSDEDLIANEKCVITISENGYIKRLKEETYTKQSRGGKGKKGTELREEDQVDTIKTCDTHDYVLFFTNTGKVYKMRAWEIPESSRTAKGTPLVNFLSMMQTERVGAFLTMNSETMEGTDGFIVLVTRAGTVKKTPMEEFSNIRTSGIKAINLAQSDDLVYAGLTTGEDSIMMTTCLGQSIRFSEKDVRPMGRSAGGVLGIRFTKNDDYVVGAVIISKESKKSTLLAVSERGYGKRTLLTEYKIQNRGGSGIRTFNLKNADKVGNLVSAREISDQTKPDVLIATQSGKMIRLESREIPILGRDTLGVRLITLDKDDKVISVAVLEEEPELEEVSKEE